MHSHPSAVKRDFTVDSSLKNRRLNPDTEMKKKCVNLLYNPGSSLFKHSRLYVLNRKHRSD